MTQEAPNADNTILVGKIVSSFGVRGQLKMTTITSHIDHFCRKVKTIYLGPKFQAYPIRQAFEHKPGLLVIGLLGVTDRDAAEEFRGLEVFIRESDAAPLEDGEYFIHQLYNLRVELEDGTEFGRVREVLETGANDVLVVARPNLPEVLLPMIKDVVVNLDIPNGRIVVHILEGLIPEN
jgi:16S rRNA processing protein RimM